MTVIADPAAFRSTDVELGDEPTFRLADLVRLHDSPVGRHPLEISESMGDGALLTLLPSFANVRRTLLALDYRFLPAREISGAHTIFPVLELVGILESKTIPYRKTADSARQLLKRVPDLRLDDRMFSQNCVASYTYHEGAHAIFYEIACARDGIPRGGRLVEVLLASEAFAMAFEQYAALLTAGHTRRAIPLFIALNSYAKPLTYATSDCAKAASIARLRDFAINRPKEILCYLACAYLIAMLRPIASVDKPALARWFADYATFIPRQWEDAELLMAIGLQVDQVFRSDTQRNFYQLLNLERELASVLEAPLEESFRGDAAFHSYLPHAIATVIAGDPVQQHRHAQCQADTTAPFFA